MIFIFKWAIFKVSRQLSGVYTLEIKHGYQKIMVFKMYLLWQMANVLVSIMFNCYPHLPNRWVGPGGLPNGPSCFVLRGATSCCEAMLFLWFASSPGIWGNQREIAPGDPGNFPDLFRRSFLVKESGQFFLPICDFSLSINENWWICIKLDSAFRLHRFWVPPTKIPSLV